MKPALAICRETDPVAASAGATNAAVARPAPDRIRLRRVTMPMRVSPIRSDRKPAVQHEFAPSCAARDAPYCFALDSLALSDRRRRVRTGCICSDQGRPVRDGRRVEIRPRVCCSLVESMALAHLPPLVGAGRGGGSRGLDDYRMLRRALIAEDGAT